MNLLIVGSILYKLVGRSAKFTNIRDGEYLRFAINEYPNRSAHRNNQGYMTIEIHAEDFHQAETSRYESCS